MIQIVQIVRDIGNCLVRPGCTCGDPAIALYPCEDDQIIFCTHCGEITTRERLLNESSAQHLSGPIQWLNVSDRAECPLINIALSATVRALPEHTSSQAVELEGSITKISAEKCFLRLEGTKGFAGLHRQQHVELLGEGVPFEQWMRGLVEEVLWPHGPQGPAYYKIRFLPQTPAQKTGLEDFFQATCGLRFEARVLLYEPSAAFSPLRRLILECLPKARVMMAANEEEFGSLMKEGEPGFCLLPVVPALLEAVGLHLGQDHHAPRPHVILLLPERNHATIREALLWGADDILYPDSGKEALSRAIQRCQEQETNRKVKPSKAAPGHGEETHSGGTLSRIVRPRPTISDEDAVRMLCMASETHDAHSANHLNRIAAYSAAIARQMGLVARRVAALATASKLHDIGKMGVPDEILHKTGALTDEERLVMQEHTRFGYRILQVSNSELMRLGASIALCHHERSDGGGYPRGLAGDKIPLEARIVSVADVFDALTTQRVYKAAWSNERAVEHMQEQAGQMFAPEVIEAFLRVEAEIEHSQLRFMDDFRNVWTERRRNPRLPTPPVPVKIEIAMPDQTFRPVGLNGLVQNISPGGMKLLLHDISQDLFTLLVSARRYAKLTCRAPEWRVLDHAFCGVTWVDYYAVPDPHQCLLGLNFQKEIPELEGLLCNLEQD